MYLPRHNIALEVRLYSGIIEGVILLIFREDVGLVGEVDFKNTLWLGRGWRPSRCLNQTFRDIRHSRDRRYDYELLVSRSTGPWSIQQHARCARSNYRCKCEIIERVFLLEQQFVLRPNNYPWYCTCKSVVAYAFVVYRRATTVHWTSSAVGDFGANSANIYCKSPRSSGKEDRWLTASRFEVLRGDASV